MTWVMVASVAVLAYFAAHPAKIADRPAFRTAWIWLVLVAVNLTYSELSRPLSDGDEVALLPPVAGG